MPNHVTTILTIEHTAGMELATIRKAFVNDKGLVDFDVILPQPACLKDFEPHYGVLSRASAALGLLPDPKTFGSSDDIVGITKQLEFSNAVREITKPARKEDIPSIVRAIQNYADCGHMYWYDWSNENWGTKWNCYGQPKEGHPADARTFEFETAWSHPVKMIALVSTNLPGVVFHVQYADEDLGSNCGEYRIRDGEMFDVDIAARWDQRSDADKSRWTEKAFRIRFGKDEDREAHGYDENWRYSEEVYEAHEAKTAASKQGEARQ